MVPRLLTYDSDLKLERGQGRGKEVCTYDGDRRRLFARCMYVNLGCTRRDICDLAWYTLFRLASGTNNGNIGEKSFSYGCCAASSYIDAGTGSGAVESTFEQMSQIERDGESKTGYFIRSSPVKISQLAFWFYSRCCFSISFFLFRRHCCCLLKSWAKWWHREARICREFHVNRKWK